MMPDPSHSPAVDGVGHRCGRALAACTAAGEDGAGFGVAVLAAAAVTTTGGWPPTVRAGCAVVTTSAATPAPTPSTTPLKAARIDPPETML